MSAYQLIRKVSKTRYTLHTYIPEREWTIDFLFWLHMVTKGWRSKFGIREIR